jgi:hypothetical protein
MKKVRLGIQAIWFTSLHAATCLRQQKHSMDIFSLYFTLDSSKVKKETAMSECLYSSNIHILKPTHQSGDMRRWGLCDSTWRQSPHDWVNAFIKETWVRPLTLLTMWGCNEKELSMNQEAGPHQTSNLLWSWTSQASKTVRMKFLSFIATQSVIFSYSSLNKLRQKS